MVTLPVCTPPEYGENNAAGELIEFALLEPV
jgi:hypothetical protein